MYHHGVIKPLSRLKSTTPHKPPFFAINSSWISHLDKCASQLEVPILPHLHHKRIQIYMFGLLGVHVRQHLGRWTRSTNEACVNPIFPLSQALAQSWRLAVQVWRANESIISNKDICVYVHEVSPENQHRNRCKSDTPRTEGHNSGDNPEILNVLDYSSMLSRERQQRDIARARVKDEPKKTPIKRTMKRRSC